MAIGNLTKSNVKTRYLVGGLLSGEHDSKLEGGNRRCSQLPYEYCIHDKDLVNDPDEQEKLHVHIIIAFPNTTTYKYAVKLSQSSLQKERVASAPERERSIVSIEYAHKYLIHNTKSAKEKENTSIPQKKGISGNMFDIGAYIPVSKSEEDEIFNQIIDTIYVCFESFVDVDQAFSI